MRFHNYESVASGSPAAAATSASGIRIVVFRLRHHVGSQPQGAERCDGRDIEDDPHGRSPLRKPAVQVSRQELLAARVIELGLAPAVAGKSFECDFPASLAAALQTFAIASRPNGFVVQDRHRPRWFFPPSEPQCSREKGVASCRLTPQCSMDASSRDKRAVLKQLVIIQGINLGVAPARRATPPSHRQTSATKRVYRTAIE